MSFSGKKSYWYGKHLSEETKRKISLAHKGKKLSKEHIKKMSESLKGRKVSLSTRLKLSKANRGHKPSKATRLRLSISHRGKYGQKASNWQGGIHALNRAIRSWIKYKAWRSNIFERDKWTCQTCGKRGCYLEAHHIKRISKILRENNIKTTEEILQCQEMWDLENGVTLCRDCHNLTRGGN